MIRLWETGDLWTTIQTVQTADKLLVGMTHSRRAFGCQRSVAAQQDRVIYRSWYQERRCTRHGRKPATFIMSHCDLVIAR